MTFEEKLFALANKKGLNEDNARYFEYLSVSKAIDACVAYY